MSESDWAVVDSYISDRLLADGDPVLAAILAANAKAGLPPIDVSPAQGKFLQLLVRLSGARRVLEIGTLGGYSTVWMARALTADGEVVTLEAAALHARVARENFARAGLAERIHLLEGPAINFLPELQGPFDLVFIDADKPSNVSYLEHALRLSRPGTLIVLDNVIRNGRVVEGGSTDRNVQGARAAFDFISHHPRLEATALQTVGEKGWDGFILARVSG